MKLTHSLLCAVIALSPLSVSAKEKLRVYAASSLTNVVKELASQFEIQHGIDVTTVFAGSSSLARQLTNGAPADLFISANEKWMTYLVESNVVAGDAVTNLIENKLVLVAPTGSAESFELTDSSQWQRALGKGRLAIGMPNAVPAGIYAKQSLEHLGVWSMLNKQLAPTNNVRIALTLVERQEAPLAVVYQTDAMLSDKVVTLAVLPEQTHDPIVYPLATLNEKEATLEFARYLRSESAIKVFGKYGFDSGNVRVD